jgi:hypothetical protein
MTTAPETSAHTMAAAVQRQRPYLTKDHQGNLVLSWVQATDTTGNHLMAYAVSDDGGKTFGEPLLIAATKGVYPHDENLSKILFRKNGDIMAMFAVSNPNDKNSYAGLVYYTQSFDGGKSWTTPKQLSEHAGQSIDERYFDLELLPDGEVAAIWLDSRKDTDKEGSSLYFATTRGRAGFTGEKVIDTQPLDCRKISWRLPESLGRSRRSLGSCVSLRSLRVSTQSGSLALPLNSSRRSAGTSGR